MPNKSNIEVRRDFIVPTRISIISRVRKFRPKDFTHEEAIKRKRATCPFCPGNELMTPPATLVAKIEHGEIKYYRDKDDKRVSNWFVRIFPNKYPALITALPPPTYGYHEVIVETPDHYVEPYLTSVHNYALVLKVAIRRINEISKDPQINHIILIKNYGPRSGASLEHPHMQLFATSFTLPYILEEILYSNSYFKEKGTCPYCVLIREELKSPRLVYENRSFIVVVARAPRTPYETWILPKRHSPSLIDLDDQEIIDLADALQKPLEILYKHLGNPSYNLWFHIAPKAISELSSINYHWHIEIAPVLTTWGGFERGGGVYIIPVSPEEAAMDMKKYLSLIK